MSKRSRPPPRKREPASKRARLTPVPWGELPLDMWHEILSHTGARARARCRRVCRAWHLLLRTFVVRVVPEVVPDVRRLYLIPDPGVVEMLDGMLLLPAVCPAFDGKSIQSVGHTAAFGTYSLRRFMGIDLFFTDLSAHQMIHLYADLFVDGKDPDPCISFSTRTAEVQAGGPTYRLPLSCSDMARMSRCAVYYVLHCDRHPTAS